MPEKEWFASWFDTSYYHLLYDHRNDEEAAIFVKNLVRKIELNPKEKVLDLACGMGRHARVLNGLGLDVDAVDLSSKSINEANKIKKERLNFFVHDMREIIPNRSYHAVFNLFTSFGYFSNVLDNIKMINSVKSMLTDHGYFIIDFLNAHLLRNNLVSNEVIQKHGIQFNIERFIKNSFVEKHIKFDDAGEHFHYKECVQLFTLKDFKELLNADFEILFTFGDFDLNPFDEFESPRLILIARKK